MALKVLKTIIAIAALASLLWTKAAWSCATVSASEIDQPPVISGETALIAWDAKSGVEHFIRSARFNGAAKDFGFLVPTPNRPQISEVDEQIFDVLAEQTLPKHENHIGWETDFTPFIYAVVHTVLHPPALESSMSASAGPVAFDKASVDVLEEKHVGNYQASVLRADDAQALTLWLKKNHFYTDEDTTHWLEPYTKNHWFITAFKVEENQQGTFDLKAVRLSFKTARPFYPYREPESARKNHLPSRSLRVFFVAKEGFSGAIETPDGSHQWPGTLTYAAPLETTQAQEVQAVFNSTSQEALDDLRLTVFEDKSSPRPGIGEVYFKPDEKQADLTPPPIITWESKTLWLPPDVILIVGFLLWRWKCGVKRHHVALNS